MRSSAASPWCLAGAPAAASAAPVVTRHAIRELRRGLTRILLAEDNITNQQVAVGLLKRLGLRADAVANGAEAIHALETLPYDLVLMDVQMPEMGGLEATRRIRSPHSAVRNREIPIIAMTANARQSDRAECLDAGMNDYVSKPISLQVLTEALDRWLPKETAVTAAAMRASPEIAAQASASGPDAPVFDRAALLERIANDEEFGRVLLEGFLDDMPKQLRALKEFLNAGNKASAARQVHTIKGAAAVIGGEALRDAARAVERSLQSGDPDAIAARLSGLEAQFAMLRVEVERYLDPDRRGEPGEESEVVDEGARRCGS